MLAPLIAISTWRRPLPTSLGERTELVTLGTEYADAVRHAGGVPVLIDELDAPGVDAVLDRVDGVLLTGGQDVGGASRDDQGRDELEFALLAGAAARRMPVFGICRGLQVVNVFHGGTLMEDLPETAAHPRAAGQAQLSVRHPITTTTRWVQDALPADGNVNSIHHQAVDTLGDALVVTATSADGIVEALESTRQDWFLRAVQWHPEKLPDTPGVEHADRLLAPFIAAAAASPRIERTGTP